MWEGVDMELRYDSDHAVGFAVHALKADSLFPVCSPDLAPFLNQPADLVEQRLIHVIGNRRGWTDWLRAAGLDELHTPVAVQVDTSAIALSLCEHGVGVALGHSSLVTHLISSGRLVRPFPEELEAAEIFHLVLPSARPPNDAADVFAKWVLEQN
jgi:LysR family glycine cleavage system transcriptional activator